MHSILITLNRDEISVSTFRPTSEVLDSDFWSSDIGYVRGHPRHNSLTIPLYAALLIHIPGMIRSMSSKPFQTLIFLLNCNKDTLRSVIKSRSSWNILNRSKLSSIAPRSYCSQKRHFRFRFIWCLVFRGPASSAILLLSRVSKILAEQHDDS